MFGDATTLHLSNVGLSLACLVCVLLTLNSVSDEAFAAMGQFFPRFTVRDVECGHWGKLLSFRLRGG